jgi:hypothetical protein
METFNTNLVAHLRNAETNHIGFSYNINTGQSNPEHGYMVSIAGHEETAPQGCDLLAFGRSYTIKHADKIAENPYLFIGCWWNGSSFVFDLSEHVSNREVAIILGEVYNQEAIWDCESGSEYRLTREGESEQGTESEIDGMILAMYEVIDEYENFYNHSSGEMREHYEAMLEKVNKVLNLLNEMK